MSYGALFVEAWDALERDNKVWGFVQNPDAGILVLAINERVAEQVLAWELAGQVMP